MGRKIPDLSKVVQQALSGSPSHAVQNGYCLQINQETISHRAALLTILLACLVQVNPVGGIAVINFSRQLFLEVLIMLGLQSDKKRDQLALLLCLEVCNFVFQLSKRHAPII